MGLIIELQGVPITFELRNDLKIVFDFRKLKGVFAKNERWYRLNAIKSAFDHIKPIPPFIFR